MIDMTASISQTNGTHANGAPASERPKILVQGKLLKMAKLQSEYYVPSGDPEELLRHARASSRADLITFVESLDSREPKHPFHFEKDAIAVLPISTYQHWFDKQLYFKPRNKLRKSLKNGVEARYVEFNDELVGKIKAVYDESPVRQGKPNKHYQKDLETLKREHQSFLDRSQFIGVFFKDEMIGFAKVTRVGNAAILMNIVSMICHRDKAPTNALIAKSVEYCAEHNITSLMYGVWGGRGLSDFKAANGFERTEVARYFVPLTLKGRVALKLGFHRPLMQRLPEPVVKLAADMRRRLAKEKKSKDE